jgi:hypothetical protein
MIKIFLLVLLFLLIVYISIQKKEGLMNQYSPINVVHKKNDDGTEDPTYIWKKLTDPNSDLYNEKYPNMNEEDVILDMKYFNNATNILFAYQAKNIGISE